MKYVFQVGMGYLDFLFRPWELIYMEDLINQYIENWYCMNELFNVATNLFRMANENHSGLPTIWHNSVDLKLCFTSLRNCLQADVT